MVVQEFAFRQSQDIQPWERVQVALFESREPADKLARELNREYFLGAEVLDMDGDFVVQVPRASFHGNIKPFGDYIRGFMAALRR